MNKKQILKKYVGKGGPNDYTPFNAMRDMVVKGGGGLMKDIGRGIGKGVRALMAPSVRVNNAEKALDEQRRQEGEDMKAGRERYSPKQEVLKNIVQKKIPPRNEMNYDVIRKLKPNPDSVNYKS